jgi:hypothetical protein
VRRNHRGCPTVLAWRLWESFFYDERILGTRPSFSLLSLTLDPSPLGEGNSSRQSLGLRKAILLLLTHANRRTGE